MRRNPVFIVALSLAIGLGCLLAANPVLHSAPQPATNSSATELNADVIDVAEENDRYVVSVRFTGLLREQADAARGGGGALAE